MYVSGERPVLYSFRRCPYAIRARMALVISGIHCELREVKLQNKPEQMIAVSRKGTVPVLVLEDQQVIDESLDVMRWALSQSDPDNWLSGDTTEGRNFIQRNDDDFKPRLDQYKYHVRFPEHPQEYYRIEAEKFLQDLNLQLNDTVGEGLLGEGISITDVAIFPFIRQFSRVDSDWFNRSPYPDLKKWLSDIENGELFRSVMKKYSVWKGSEKGVDFP